MAETLDDQLARVRMMASGDGDWDLSPNDRAALVTVLRLAAANQKTAGEAEPIGAAIYDHEYDPGDGVCIRCSHDALSSYSRCRIPPKK